MILVSTFQGLSKNGRKAAMFIDSNGKEYLVSDLAKIPGIDPSALRERIKHWGFKHPDLLKKKMKHRGSGRKTGARDIAITLDITPGDLEGKHTGRTSSVERRALLRMIPSPAEYELNHL